MMRSPGSICSSPLGKIMRSPRIDARPPWTRRACAASRSGRPIDRVVAGLGRDVELDDLHAAVGEDVGLAGRRQTDDAGDRVRRLELRRDHEVDVDLAVRQASSSSTLVVRTTVFAFERRLTRIAQTRFASSRGLQASSRSASSTPRLAHDLARGAVALHGPHVVGVGERLQPGGIDVDDREVVLLVQRVDERAADVPGSQHDDLHARSFRTGASRFADDARDGALARMPAPAARLGVDVSGALNLVGSLLKSLGLGVRAAGRGRRRLRRAGAAVPGRGRVTSGVRPRAGAADKRQGARRRARGLPRRLRCCGSPSPSFGALPYLFGEPQLSHPVDALFESMSGFSTTGASVLTDVEALTARWRCGAQFTAWIGGARHHRAVPRRAAAPERRRPPGAVQDRDAGPGDRRSRRRSARPRGASSTLYVAITALEVLVLATLGWMGIDDRMTLFKAVGHSFATSPRPGSPPRPGRSSRSRPRRSGRSCSSWSSPDELRAAYAGHRAAAAAALSAATRSSACISLLLVLAPALVARRAARPTTPLRRAAVRHAVFNTVSMLTTTGFASADFNLWAPLTSLCCSGCFCSAPRPGPPAVR